MDGRDARCRALAAWFALCGVAAAAPTLAQRVAQADRAAAQRFLTLAVAEKAAKHGALAQRAFRRVVDLDPENSTARRELGFKKGPTGWKREVDPDVPVPPKGREEEARADRFRADGRAIEEWRAKEIVKVCADAAPDEARPLLLPLLDRVPRLTEVHVALGHAKVGERYVRPELAALAERAPALQKAWADVRTREISIEPTGESLKIEGVGEWPTYRVGKRTVGAAYAEADAKAAAVATERAQVLLRLLLGADGRLWDPTPVTFLAAKEYEAYVRARESDAEKAKSLLRSASNVFPDGFVLRALPAGVADIYAHNAGYYTGQGGPRAARPKDAEPDDAKHYAWWCEGLGYFLSLELTDSATTSFYSSTESQRKLEGTPPPTKRDRASYLAWVRARELEGLGHPLRDVLARSLNSLDLHASMEAWTFVRFLALYDPDAFRRLPDALGEQTAGSEPDRVDEALRKAYGKGVEELERLWRAWLLEVA